MKLYKLTFVIIILFSMASCSSKSTTNSSDSADTKQVSKKTYQEVAVEKFGEGKIDYQLNESKTFVICSKTETKNNFSVVKFFVCDVSTGEVVYEPSTRIERVKWISDAELEAYKIIGMPTADDQGNKLIYNVNTKIESTPNN